MALIADCIRKNRDSYKDVYRLYIYIYIDRQTDSLQWSQGSHKVGKKKENQAE